ncbi:MAG TPA: NFACT family protein [Treponemataceae bacterium]|nr:NFACT family protein [Treponemataceae bacterium]
MSLNCAEIDLVLNELPLKDSFIQNIVQPSYDTIALYLYKTESSQEKGNSSTLLICLAAGVCRLHETRRKIPKNDKPLRFMEFLKSRIKGSRIQAVEQLNNDRIIRFTLTHGEDSFYMFIRLWSGAANVVVTDFEHRILDVFYRRPKKNEISGGVWETPEPQKSQTQWSVRVLEGEGSFNEKIENWYATHAKTLSRVALLEEAQKRYDTKKKRLDTALSRLEKKRKEFLSADKSRHFGDLLTANLWAIKLGMSSIEIADYENEEQIVIIELDPHLKPQENAAKYYEKYRKAVSGLSELEADIAATQNTLDNLKDELLSLHAEQNPLIIQQKLRRQSTPKQQIEKKYPGLAFKIEDWLILVGRTASENDELLRRHVKGLDLWLHTRDWPGGYVFIKNRAGKSIPLEILLDAGTLALFYSKGRKANTADLYYTQVKYLRRAKNAPKGTVLPSNEKNLTIKLDDLRLKRLETCRIDI